MAGTFNQSLQCTQDVFIGFQAPLPPVSPADMDVDKPSARPETNNTVRVGVHRVCELVSSLPATPSQLPSPSPGPGPDSKLKIPEFLIGKHNIYCYLNCIEESRFQDLLKNYISFEATNCSCIHGALSTYCRPDVIGWWSGQAHPDRLPPYNSLKSLTESIVEWWIYLQPEWRKITLSEISRVGGIGNICTNQV